MLFKIRGLIPVFFFSIQIFSQSPTYNLSTLSLKDLSEFNKPGNNWSIVGEINAGYNDLQLKNKPGTGVLLNTISSKDKKYQTGQDLYTNFEHGDIYLELDFMMARGSNSGIYLQGRYEVQLIDSWGLKNMHPGDCGGVYYRWDEKIAEANKNYEGSAPLSNACFAPGLWQHLQIEFQAPRFDAAGKKTEPAKFVKVILNGVVIHENIIASGPTRSGNSQEIAMAPIRIQGDHGTVAFKNIKYALLGSFDASVKDISYEYYEGRFDDFDKVTADKLTRKGSASGIDYRIGETPNNMCLYFNGKLIVKEAGDYELIVKRNGFANLSVDGKELVKSRWMFKNENSVGKINLTAGEHTFKLGYLKNTNWMPPALGLLIQRANTKAIELHVGASLPEPDAVPQIEVVVNKEPELVRSFLMYKGRKLTHAISVGDPLEVNYSYNLNQGGLLHVWKGKFLNTTEMWYERGEPQTAEALGGAIILSGKCPLEIGESSIITLHDSLNDRTELIYKGYALNKERYPVFQYSYKGIGFTDIFKPFETKGITREINLLNTPTDKTYYRIADSFKIQQVGDGLYAVDDQKYYISFSDLNLKPIIHKSGSGYVLLVAATNSKKQISSLKYSIVW